MAPQVLDNTSDFEEVQTLSHHSERVWCVSWNHAGTILASCGEDKSLCLWVREGSTWTYAFSMMDNHTRTIRYVSWSPTDNYLATASFDSTVGIWRIQVADGVLDLQSIAVLEGHTNEVKCVSWSLSGYLLATCGRDKSVWIWEFDDEEDFQCVSVLQPHNADVKSVFWHPIKEILGSTSYDNTINLYKEDLDDWTVACKLVGHDSTVWKAEFSPVGDMLASVSEDTTIKLWHELPSENTLKWVCFKTLSDFHKAPVYSLNWSPCSQYLATCGGDNNVFVFRVTSTSSSPDDGLFTKEVDVWKQMTRAHKGDVNSVAWGPKLEAVSQSAPRYLLATGGDDREDTQMRDVTARSSSIAAGATSESKKTRKEVLAERDKYVQAFNQWNEEEQVQFLCQLLACMSHAQHSQINSLLEPLLQCDIVNSLPSNGVPHISANILSYLDASSLLAAEAVSKNWQTIIVRFQLWRKLIARRVANDKIWRGLAERRGWLSLIQLLDASVLASLLEQRLASSPYCQSPGKDLEFPVMRPPGQSVQASLFGDYWSSALPNSLIVAATHAVSTSQAPCLSPENHPCSLQRMMLTHRFYKQLYPRIIRDISRINENWNNGRFRLTRIRCHSDSSRGVYCLQYDSEKIVSGLRDDTIKVWRRVAPSSKSSTGTNSRRVEKPSSGTTSYAGVAGAAITSTTTTTSTTSTSTNTAAVATEADSAAEADGYQCTQVLRGHEGSVLCLQYEGNLLISGSSDSKVRLWDLSTGECLHILEKHYEAVLHLRFQNGVLVTCSKDRYIAVWDMGENPKDIQLRTVLSGHRAAVNVVDFDEKYIVSASGDRTIKVWRTDTSVTDPVRTLSGHRRGIACLQYRAPYVVSGSSDYTIRVWDIESGVCFRVLEGHDELVRCIRFDHNRIVSGDYNGKIKVWDFKAALNPLSRTSQLCIKTLHEHTGRVFRLQFDDFQIVSSSHDDSILIWDFTYLDANTTTNPDDETGAGENDDGFFNEEAAAAAAGGGNGNTGTAAGGGGGSNTTGGGGGSGGGNLPTFSQRQARLVHARSPQIANTLLGALAGGNAAATAVLAAATLTENVAAPSSSSPVAEETVVPGPSAISTPIAINPPAPPKRVGGGGARYQS